MNGIEIAVIVVVAVLFAAALGYIVYRKLKHKSGCDCGGNCASCGSCHADHEDRSSTAKCPHCAEHND